MGERQVQEPQKPQSLFVFDVSKRHLSIFLSAFVGNACSIKQLN